MARKSKNGVICTRKVVKTRVFGKSVNSCLVEKQSSDRHVVNGCDSSVQHSCSLPVAHSMASQKFHNVRDGKSIGVEQGSAEVCSKTCNVRDGKITGVEQGSDEVSPIETHNVTNHNIMGMEQGNAEMSVRNTYNVRDVESVEVDQCDNGVPSANSYNVRDSKSAQVGQTNVEVSGNFVQGHGLNQILGKNNELSNPNYRGLTPQCHHSHRNKSPVPDSTNSDPDEHLGLNAPLVNCREITNGLTPIYDINAGVEEKFVNSIMHFNQFDLIIKQPLMALNVKFFKSGVSSQNLILVLYHWANN